MKSSRAGKKVRPTKSKQGTADAAKLSKSSKMTAAMDALVEDFGGEILTASQIDELTMSWGDDELAFGATQFPPTQMIPGPVAPAAEKKAAAAAAASAAVSNPKKRKPAQPSRRDDSEEDEDDAAPSPKRVVRNEEPASDSSQRASSAVASSTRGSRGATKSADEVTIPPGQGLPTLLLKLRLTQKQAGKLRKVVPKGRLYRANKNPNKKLTRPPKIPYPLRAKAKDLETLLESIPQLESIEKISALLDRNILSNTDELKAELDSIERLVKNLELLTSEPEQPSMVEKWFETLDPKLQGAMETLDAKIERSASEWIEKLNKAPLEVESHPKNYEDLKKEYTELQIRFERLSKLRMTEPEELLEDFKTISLKQSDAYENQLRLVTKESDALKEEVERLTQLNLEKESRLKAAGVPARASISESSTQTETVPGLSVASSEQPLSLDLVNVDQLMEAQSDAEVKCKKLEIERDELAKAGQMVAMERDSLQAMVEQMQQAIATAEKEKGEKERGDSHPAVQFWREKAQNYHAELESLQRELEKTKAELAFQATEAQKAKSEDTYVHSIERRLRLYEGVTGLRLERVDPSTRPVEDEEDDEASLLDDSCDEGFDRRLSVLSNRRKSVRSIAPLELKETESCIVYRCEHKGAAGSKSIVVILPSSGKSTEDILPDYLTDEISFEADMIPGFFKRINTLLSTT
ncbi:hypothetical protein HDU96_005039 [Phlyctochytrium bullatum]|nr:hypothetical protein HDU96_005039 [Phlyctochytrium bullatum]